MSATAVRRTDMRCALRVLLVLAATLCVLGLGTVGSTAMSSESGHTMAGMAAMASTPADRLPTTADSPTIAGTAHDPGTGDPMSCPDAGKGQASACAALTGGHSLVHHPHGSRLAVDTWSPMLDRVANVPAAVALVGVPSPAHPPDLLALNILRV